MRVLYYRGYRNRDAVLKRFTELWTRADREKLFAETVPGQDKRRGPWLLRRVWEAVKADIRAVKGVGAPEPKKAAGARPEAPEKPIAGGTIPSPDEGRQRLTGKRFILTSAQNNTYVHPEFWLALKHFAAVNDARLIVSRFTYNKAAWQQFADIAEKNKSRAGDDIWYDPQITPYVLDENVKLADDLVLCGELDILPTAATPLNTLHSYTGPNSGIIPHAKVHMRSLATGKYEKTKFLYTTGAVTKRNYLNRKTGQVASFHHTFAALYVEVDDAGDWFARQLVADDNGVFYDIDTAYGPGWHAPASEFGDTVLTLGDIHIESIDRLAALGAYDLLLTVKPKYVFLHDLYDFKARNHHNLRDPHYMASIDQNDDPYVQNGIAEGARFVRNIIANVPGTTPVVVRSNHDQALETWLKNPDGFRDTHNAYYWAHLNAAWLRAIRAGKTRFDVIKYALIDSLQSSEDREALQRARVLQEDESFFYLDVEHGMHGHRGINGARGNPLAFRQLGRKANTGHTHSAGIIDGVYTAGTLSKLDLGYNKGPSSWSHSHIITYPSGKRTIITQVGNKWRAPNDFRKDQAEGQ